MTWKNRLIEFFLLELSTTKISKNLILYVCKDFNKSIILVDLFLVGIIKEVFSVKIFTIGYIIRKIFFIIKTFYK